MTAKLSDFDKKNLDRILAGHGDWFSAHLMRLIMKADLENRTLLGLVFPDHVEAYVNYQRYGFANEELEADALSHRDQTQ